MNKDDLNKDNKQKLKEAAERLRVSEDEVLSKVPSGILLASMFNPKALGGYLKNMQPGITSGEALHNQLSKDPFGRIFLSVLDKTPVNPSQQQEGTSSAASSQNWDIQVRLEQIAMMTKKSKDEIFNEIPENIRSNHEQLQNYLKELIKETAENLYRQNNPPNSVAAGSSHSEEEMSSAASCQEKSAIGWSQQDKALERVAKLSNKSEAEILGEIPQDILSGDPECLKDYLKALIESLKNNGSCTNDNLPNDVTAGSSHSEEEMSSAASRQESTLGWGVHNKLRLKAIAQLSKKSENEVLNEIPQDILSEALSNPECLKEYLAALIESLKINDSCTNDTPPNDVTAGSSHEMPNATSYQECDLTGVNSTCNKNIDDLD